MTSDAIVAIQDMGAAGLTSSSVEMASKGGVGFELDLDKVPQREAGMVPYEMMLSESQERMLIVLKPDREDFAKGIFEKWGLDFAVIGRITDTGRLRILFGGEVAADIPIASLVDDTPEYERPWVAGPEAPRLEADDVPRPNDLGAALLKLLGGPNLSSRRWIWEQYDHMVMADTLGFGRPGGDAAVVRVHGTNKGLAMSTDCTPRYVAADPEEGGKQAVAESWRNLTACGAKPLAITDCLNFGNPERPEIMGQFALAVRGIGAACRALDYPVVSGNVSFYNETNGKAITPTPTIGGLGLIADLGRRASPAFGAAGEAIFLIGESRGHLGASRFLKEILGRTDGAPPTVDLAAERRNGDFVRSLIETGRLTCCHDLADGGLLVALSEMALAGRIGAEIDGPGDLAPHAWAFGEDQARYLLGLAPDKAEAVLSEAADAGVPAQRIGTVGGPSLKIKGLFEVGLEDLEAAHEGWFDRYMSRLDK